MHSLRSGGVYAAMGIAYMKQCSVKRDSLRMRFAHGGLEAAATEYGAGYLYTRRLRETVFLA